MSAIDNKQDVQSRLDNIIEAESAKGFRIKVVPDDIRVDVKEAGLPDIARVRFSRLNPARRRIASELVQRAYQKDLKNRDILSNAEVLLLVQDRGEWSPEMDKKIGELDSKVQGLMVGLYSEGIATESGTWADEIVELSDNVREAIDSLDMKTEEERTKLHAVFNRWVQYEPSRRDEYTEQFAADQEREKYSANIDFGKLVDAMALKSIEDMNVMHKLEDRLNKIRRFVELSDLRREHAELTTKRAKIFADTVESRRDHNEELARLYVTCEKWDDYEDVPRGSLSANFDGIFDYPDSGIKWLVEEAFMFHAGIPDESREFMETFGFLRAERIIATEQPPSAESPAPESSSLDATPSTGTPSISTESEALTT